MKNKYKYLLKNIGLLTISNFSSKLLSFFLVPLYTAVLSTSDYGSYDLIYTTVTLLTPILTLNISESILRFSLDENNDKSQIMMISIKYFLSGFIIFLILFIVNCCFKFVYILNEYSAYFIFLFVTTTIFQMLQYFVRGLGKIFDLAMSGVINTVIMISLNLYFLLVLKLGLDGYFLASIISYVFSCFYLLIRIRIFKYLNLNKINKKLEKSMIMYSRPLVLNSLSWWINNASDRYIVTWMCGLSINGIYSVAYKIPSILSVVQTIFNQAWQLSIVKLYDKNDRDIFLKNIYCTYNFIMIVACSVMIIFTKIIASILYSKDFYSAWRYVPLLMISVLFGALAGVLGGVFQAAKDSKFLSYTTVIGAISNFILNIILIYKIGVMGAAMSTAMSYFIVWLMRLIKVKRYVSLKLNLKRDFFSYIILILQIILILTIKYNIVLYTVEIFMLLFILFINHKEIKKILKKISKNKNGDINEKIYQ